MVISYSKSSGINPSPNSNTRFEHNTQNLFSKIATSITWFQKEAWRKRENLKRTKLLTFRYNAFLSGTTSPPLFVLFDGREIIYIHIERMKTGWRGRWDEQFSKKMRAHSLLFQPPPPALLFHHALCGKSRRGGGESSNRICHALFKPLPPIWELLSLSSVSNVGEIERDEMFWGEGLGGEENSTWSDVLPDELNLNFLFSRWKLRWQGKENVA